MALEGGSDGHVVSIKRAADGRCWEIVDEKIEKSAAKNGSMWNTSVDRKEATCLILKNRATAPVRKKRLSSLNKARRVVSRNKVVEENGMPYRVKGFNELESSKGCPGAQFEFFKPI